MQAPFCCCCRGGRDAELAWRPLCFGQWAVIAYATLTVLFLGTLAVSGNLTYKYFTYWGWTWQATWSVAWSVFIVADGWGRTASAEGTWLFCTAGFSLSYLTVVGVIITVVPAEEGTDWVLDMSGTTSLGLANLGNLVAHYLPWAVAAMLVITRKSALTAVATEMDTRLRPVNMHWAVPIWLWVSSLTGLIALSNIWSAWFDFNTVYLTSIDEWLALLMGVAGIVCVAAVLHITAYRPNHTKSITA